MRQYEEEDNWYDIAKFKVNGLVLSVFNIDTFIKVAGVILLLLMWAAIPTSFYH